MADTSIEVMIWILNFVFVYFAFYKRGYDFVAGLFVVANSILVSLFLESTLAVLTIFVGITIGILMSMNTLKMIWEDLT